MEGLPKLVVLVLAMVAVWYFRRWFQAQRRNLMQRRSAPAAASPGIEDLVRCGLCADPEKRTP
jgi:hypothetical protein